MERAPHKHHRQESPWPTDLAEMVMGMGVWSVRPGVPDWQAPEVSCQRPGMRELGRRCHAGADQVLSAWPQVLEGVEERE